MNKRPFTLIELLAVVTTIGILIGLILTIGPQVRESARRKECGSHLQQIGLGVEVYAKSHGFQYPFRATTTTEGVTTQGTETGYKLLQVIKGDMTNHDINSIYYCPSADITDEVRKASYIAHANPIINYNNLDSTFVYVLDKETNHVEPIHFKNVLYADGHVEGFSGTKNEHNEDAPITTGENPKTVKQAKSRRVKLRVQ